VVYFLRNVLIGAFGDSVPARLVPVAIPALAGILVYLILARVFHLDEIKTVFSMLKRRRKEGV